MTRAILKTVGLSLCMTLCFTDAARARELGERGNLVLGAERVFGFYVGSRSIDTPGGDIDLDFSGVGLGWDADLSFFNRPRLAIDFLLTNALSLGGAFGFFAGSVEDADGNGLLFAGRVGYVLRISHAVTIWPRGGLTFYTINSDGLAGGDISQFGFTLEGMFTLAPDEGWALMLGPTLDLGVAGGAAGEDMTEYSVGVAVGLIGWVGL